MGSQDWYGRPLTTYRIVLRTPVRPDGSATHVTLLVEGYTAQGAFVPALELAARLGAPSDCRIHVETVVASSIPGVPPDGGLGKTDVGYSP